jgi:hypothetical protein
MYQNAFLKKIIGTDHAISKKDEERKWNFEINFKVVTYVTNIFNFSSLSFNSTLTPKKISNWVSIWAQNGSIVQIKSSMIKLKFLKNLTITIHNEMWEG